MLNLNVVPARQVAAAAIVAERAGFALEGVAAEAYGMTLAAAGGAMIVAGKITGMTLDALSVWSGGRGGRALQSTVGCEVVAGSATVLGMGLTRTHKGGG